VETTNFENCGLICVGRARDFVTRLRVVIYAPSNFLPKEGESLGAVSAGWALFGEWTSDALSDSRFAHLSTVSD
jgi:hypothetical protein